MPTGRRSRALTLVAVVVGLCLVAAGCSGSAGRSAAAASEQQSLAPLSERRVVTGWIPYWDLEAGVASVVANADLVAEASPFWFRATTASQVVPQSGNGRPESDLVSAVTELHGSRVAVYPTVTDEGFTATTMARLLGDRDRRRTLVEQLVAMVQRTGSDGVDIDFESMNFGEVGSDRTAVKQLFPVFLARLQAALVEIGAVLSVAVPARRSASDPNWSVFDYDAIGRVVDRARIMTYDYSVANPGPIAPLDWVREVATHAATEFDGVPVSVGVPAYGRDWSVKTISGECPSGVGATSTVSATSQQALALAETYQSVPVWAADEAEYHFDYQRPYSSGGQSCVVLRRVWFGEGRSARLRLELAREAGLQGVAVWRFGDEDPSLWTRARKVAERIDPRPARSRTTAPTALDAGAELVVVGRFRVAGRPAVAGRVAVERRAPGRPWRTVAEYMTNENGRVAHVSTATRTFDWRLRLAAGWDWSTTTTRTNRVRVRHAVSASLVSPSVAPDERFVVIGSVRPADDVPIVLQRRVPAGWEKIKSGSARADGTYRVPGRLAAPGVYRLRVVAPTDARHAAGTSPVVVLSVE